MTTASSVVSHSTATITRSPGRPYGIHVSTCVQARNDRGQQRRPDQRAARCPTATARAAPCQPQHRHGRGAVEHRPARQRGGRHRQREHAGGIHRLARGQVAGQAEAEHRQEVHERHGERARSANGGDAVGRIELMGYPGPRISELDQRRARAGSRPARSVPSDAAGEIPRRWRRRANACYVPVGADGLRHGRRRSRRATAPPMRCA